jgi:acetyltransferase
VIAAIVEDLKDPRKLARVAAQARAQGKTMVFVHVGRSAAGKMMTQSHTGALAGNAEVLSAYLRRCGIAQAASYDEFVETIALFAHAKAKAGGASGMALVSGSGGGAALAADHLDAAGLTLATFDASTQARIKAVLPELETVTNPIDATGAVFYDPAIMTRLLDAVLSDPAKPSVAVAVNAVPAPHDRMRRIASAIVDAARSPDQTIVAYQVSPLGPLDAELVASLHGANIPLLLGVGSTMGALRHLRMPPAQDRSASSGKTVTPDAWDFMSLRDALAGSGVSMAEAVLASSVTEAVAAWRKFGVPVALKAEADGLLHKSDIGGVRLNCGSEAEVSETFDSVVGSARRAGFAGAKALVQPMTAGIAEAYAGIIDDPLYGPAIVFGLGGIFIEILKDTAIEMAPLTRDDALAMIHRVKGAPILLGARGRPAGDVEALAEFLVRLSQFAIANAGRFRALDLNPIIVKRAGEGVVAVDIAVDRSEAQS